MNPFPNLLALFADVPPLGVVVQTAVTTALGPFAIPQQGGFVPCDPSAGPVPVLFPANPADQTVVILADVTGKSASAGPITYACQGATLLGPIQIFDASWNGVGSLYGTTGHIAQGEPGAVWFVFVASANAWMPGN